MTYNQSLNEVYSFFQIYDVKDKNYLWLACIQISKEASVFLRSEWSNKDTLWSMFEMLYAVTPHAHHVQIKRLIADRLEK